MKSKPLAILGAIVTLLVYAALMFHLLHGCPKITRPEWTPAEKAHITTRLAYHGIEGAHPDGQGWYFFYNAKGQRCQL